MTNEQREQVNYLKDMAREFAKDSYPARALKAGAAALAREANAPKATAPQITEDHREALIELRRHCEEDCNERQASSFVEAIDAVLALSSDRSQPEASRT